MTETTKYTAPEHARNDEQLRVMAELERKGICPFCPEGLARCPVDPPIRRGQFWILTTNHWPYANTLHHFLAIHIAHAKRLADVKRGSWRELFTLFKWTERKYGLTSGAIAIRFGEPNINGATVRHLHAHLIVADPDTTKPGYKRVRFSVGPKPATK